MLVPDGRASRLAKRGKALMFSNQPCRSVQSSALSFLLGAGCAAMLVLTFAGTSLALSRASIDAHMPAFDELRLNRLPRPALTLGGWA
jgi:hypothetical protein